MSGREVRERLHQHWRCVVRAGEEGPIASPERAQVSADGIEERMRLPSPERAVFQGERSGSISKTQSVQLKQIS